MKHNKKGKVPQKVEEKSSTKRVYVAPQIEIHELDKTISLVMASYPDPGGDDKPFGAAQKDENSNVSKEIFSGNPFGGDRPNYQSGL